MCDGLGDRLVAVSLDHRAETVVKVPVRVAVDVGDARPVAVDKVDRPRIAFLIGGGDAPAEAAPCALVGLLGEGRARVQALEFDPRELGDSLAVNLDWTVDCHISSVKGFLQQGTPPKGH